MFFKKVQYLRISAVIESAKSVILTFFTIFCGLNINVKLLKVL